MNIDNGSVSPWMENTPKHLAPLREDLTTDVVVVGAGIAGLSVAYELSRAGSRVVVLDDGPIGGGESSRSTAHLVTALDRRYISLERLYGAEGARMCAQSHAAAIDRIESICSDDTISCEFCRLDGYLTLPNSNVKDGLELIEREYAAATSAGISCNIVQRAPNVAIDTGPCLQFLRQAQFNPTKYMLGLARAITARGGLIFTGSHVTTVRGGLSPCVVTESGHTIVARAVVLGTHTPINNTFAIHTKQVAYRSYVIGLIVPRGIVQPALLWDGYWEEKDVPYHYARLRLDDSLADELLIVGGEDHKTGRDDDQFSRFDRLESWARLRYPSAQNVAYRWSGQIMEPHDEIAYIGENPGSERQVFIVSGDSGNGMTYACIAGMMLPSLIEGRDHPWKKMYSPSRLPTSAVGVALAETAEMASEYVDWVKPHPVQNLSGMKPGEGVIIRKEGKLIAISKGDDGALVECSAICPHLKGVVRWNTVEKTWDCPCHGSRFNRYGQVLNSPANTNLALLRSDIEAK